MADSELGNGWYYAQAVANAGMGFMVIEVRDGMVNLVDRFRTEEECRAFIRGFLMPRRSEETIDA